MKQSYLKLAYITLAAIVAWFAIGLQFYISMPLYQSQGHTFLWSVVQILSYFTILTNIIVALAYSVILLSGNSKAGRFFSQPSTLTAISVYIGIVGFIYALVLRNIWNPQGLFKVADDLLHTINPILFIVFWFVFVPKQPLHWKLCINWLIYPFLYLIYTLLRGEISGVYPYPFVDVAAIGYAKVAINSLWVLVAFLTFSGIFIAVSRLMPSANISQ